MIKRTRTAVQPLHISVVLLLVVVVVAAVPGCNRRSSTKTEYVEVMVPQPPPPAPDPGSNLFKIEQDWEGSAHADETAASFRHWDEDGAIPASCAKCHSTTGYVDFVADGSVDGAADIDQVIRCEACHDENAIELDSVTFPSGLLVEGLGAEARCMQCHQGRESTMSVNANIAAANPTNEDTADFNNPNGNKLGFRNVHYFAAGATLYGRLAAGGYQYEGMTYEGKFPHVTEMDTCIECHNPHSLEVRVEKCADCHRGVDNVADLYDIRTAGSVADYDGDGDTEEGIRGEIVSLQAVLYAGMQQYAVKVLGTSFVYNSSAWPYFFDDAGNRFSSWTARLLKAAYNYQYAQKDPGAFAHNAKYLIELLYDSLADLNSHPLVTIPDFDQMVRNDSGHLDVTAEAFRHWDEDGFEGRAIACARCHSTDGFEFLAETGVYPEDAVPPAKHFPVSDGFRCDTCHEPDTLAAALGDGEVPAVRYLASVTLPSDVTFENDPAKPDPSFLCLQCHQGRASKKIVDEAIEDLDFGFENIHYLAAGASIFGGDGEVGYQYGGKSYVGRWSHYGTNSARCTVCHLEDHTFKPQFTAVCAACHVEATELDEIRLNRATDYDGDGSNTEKLKDEVASFSDRLWEAIQVYAADPATNGYFPIVKSDGYPYYLNDANGDGVPEVTGRNGAYSHWDAKLMKAVFNYQMSQEEPGAWAHNTHYILQLCYDSIEDLGGNLTGFTRP